MKGYTTQRESEMLNFYESLDEAGQRRYAGIEVLKLGHGGRKYIKELFGTSYDRISRGIKEIEKGIEKNGRIRKQGGGSKGKKTIKK